MHFVKTPKVHAQGRDRGKFAASLNTEDLSNAFRLSVSALRRQKK